MSSRSKSKTIKPLRNKMKSRTRKSKTRKSRTRKSKTRKSKTRKSKTRKSKTRRVKSKKSKMIGSGPPPWWRRVWHPEYQVPEAEWEPVMAFGPPPQNAPAGIPPPQNAPAGIPPPQRNIASRSSMQADRRARAASIREHNRTLAAQRRATLAEARAARARSLAGVSFPSASPDSPPPLNL
jgi:hypothetical protein